MQQFQEKYGNEDLIEFACVGYRDHSDPDGWDKDYPIKVQDFITKKLCINFVENLTEGGGIDVAEAVVDGFYALTRLDWQDIIQNKFNYVYFIADGPPHG